MTDGKDRSLFTRALDQVATFSEKNVAVLPEKPGTELVNYLAQVTQDDPQKIARLYELIIAMGRLDKYTDGMFSGTTGFAEDK